MKTIIRLLMSALVAAGTTMFLLLRYSDVELSELVADVRSSHPRNNDGPRASASPKITPAARSSSTAYVPSRTVEHKQRYLDYDKLSRDIESISATLERFNDMLAKQVNKMKGRSPGRAAEGQDGT